MVTPIHPSDCHDTRWPRPAAASGLIGAVALTFVLAGCASVPADAGSGAAAVAQVAAQRLGAQLPIRDVDGDAADDHAALDRRAAELLAAPLDADAAVQLALIRNRGLQARLADLGVAQADWLQAGRLSNPRFTFARLRRGDGADAERETERGLSFGLGHWLLRPWARELEAVRRDAVQRGVTADLLALAAQVRKAQVQAVAAGQLLAQARQARRSAEAGAELARRLEQVGNWTRLQRAREQAVYAGASLAEARAEQAALAARERLVRLLGLAETRTLRLPERLPELPDALPERGDLEQAALDQRLDLQAARLDAQAAARGAGLSRAEALLDGVELGLMRNGSNAAPTQTGVEIAFELPLFDAGDARRARAAARYRRSVHLAAQRTLEARSEVREAEAAWRSAWAIARHHRDELVPLAQRIGEENLLRYNGMLIGPFELLADARAQAAAVAAAIEAQRDFALAQADLELALVGKPELAGPAASMAPAGGDAAAGH